MPAIGESRSRTSLYDFFEDRKHRNVKNTTSVNNGVTTEEILTENGNVETLGKPSDGNETLHFLAAGETTVTPSDSERALLDHVSHKENSSIRSKTSANKRDTLDILDTGRTAKSDGEFSADIATDYPDMQGAGDPANVAIPNDDEAVQIDIILETAESEHGDRSTAITDALPSVEIDVDAIVSDDDETTTSNEQSDSDSEGEYEEEENGDVSKDLADVTCESDDSDSDECKDTYTDSESENRPCSSRKDELDADSLEMDADSLDIDVDSLEVSEQNEMDDGDSSDSDNDSEFDEFVNGYGKENEFIGDNHVGNNDDLPEPDFSNQTSERSHDRYDPNTEDEDGSSEGDSSDTTEEVDYVWIPCNTDRSDEVISGLRETFTPFQAINDDDPNEGNRPQSEDVESRESNAFQTRLHKTDGEVLMNIPLSTSFIMRNKLDCITEGAQTVSELMMALQRKRLAEIVREGSEMERFRTEASVGREEEVAHSDEDSNTTENQTDGRLDMEQKRDGSLQVQRGTKEKTEPSPLKDDNDVKDKSDVTDIKAKSKKVTKKSHGLKTKFDATLYTARNLVNKQFPKNVKTNMTSRSAAQTKVTDQYPEKNLRKGPKPVLPAISKGISKSAGQALPEKAESRCKIGRNFPKERVKNSVDHRKPALGDVTVRTSPDILKHSSPRKVALPSIPIQLHSNACFRNGQLEVEITCDDRMYSSAEPLEVKVTFVHKHVQSNRVTKPSAYKAKPARKPDKMLSSLTNPVNRNVIHQRALWPPFNTHLDPEASARHKKIFGSL